MTTFRKNLLSALAVLSMGAAAIGAQAQTQATAPASAQTQAQPTEGRYGHAASQEQRAQRAAERAQRGAERAAQRAAKLHDELKITPAQENAWNAFVASMKPPARADRANHAQRGQDRAALAALPAPQRFARHIERQKQRTAAMEQRLGALNSFYAVLTPQQKKTFDEKAAHFGGKFEKHRGHRGGWERGGERSGDTARS